MNSSSLLRVRGDVKYISNQQSPTPKVAMLKFLRLVAKDTNLESQFSQVCVIHQFQLGQEAITYGLDGETQDNRNFLYLVCQDRVRLVPSNGIIERQTLTHLVLEVLVVRESLSKLDSYYNPWVADWQEIHFVLVWRVKGDRILSNPAINEASWTGYALLLNPMKNLNAYKGEKLSLNHYCQTLWHYRKLLKEIIITSFDSALIKNPAILILDEATSSIDIDFARQFQHNLTQIN
ncbi:hypothetical protein LC607_01165 [Nostoc sp. CHAB 5824]|nr:hypothetical protein [Nostoc sp. CHAB 5824]